MGDPALSASVLDWFSNMETEPGDPCGQINLFERGRDIANTNNPVGFLAEIIKGIEAGQKERRR